MELTRLTGIHKSTDRIYYVMEPITIRIPTDTHRTLVDEADESDASMSEVAREYIEKGMDYDDLQARHDDLQRQLRAVNARQEDVGELVEYVEQERDLDRRREQRRQAPVWRRAKWWLLGEPGESKE